MSTTALTVFRQELAKMEPELGRVLPDHLSPARLARTVDNAIRADLKLLDCNRQSLWKGVMSAAVFGLEIDNRQSCLVRFKQQVQWIPMVAGLISLAYNSHFLLEAHVIRKQDEFEFELGVDHYLRHKPTLAAKRHYDAKGEAEKGHLNPIVGSYAIARPQAYRDVLFEVLSMDDIIHSRDKSASYKFKPESSPWSTDFAAMARKTAIRSLVNHLPWTVQKAADLEIAADQGKVASATRGEDGVIIIDAKDIPDKPADEKPEPKDITPAKGGGQLTMEDLEKQNAVNKDRIGAEIAAGQE